MTKGDANNETAQSISPSKMEDVLDSSMMYFDVICTDGSLSVYLCYIKNTDYK